MRPGPPRKLNVKCLEEGGRTANGSKHPPWTRERRVRNKGYASGFCLSGLVLIHLVAESSNHPEISAHGNIKETHP